MTMLGRFEPKDFCGGWLLPAARWRLLKRRPQGIMQHRHLDIDYDVAVLTNLYPSIWKPGGFEIIKMPKANCLKF